VVQHDDVDAVVGQRQAGAVRADEPGAPGEPAPGPPQPGYVDVDTGDVRAGRGQFVTDEAGRTADVEHA
jgi:hypothetical protein